jgi:hypothetical protein
MFSPRLAAGRRTSAMPRRPPSFTKSDAVRAIRAAITAGVPNPRIEINRAGTITIIAGDPPKKNAAPTDTPESIIEQL